MNRPLRILFVLNDPGGGATQGILEMLRGLPRDAYQAFLVTPRPPNSRRQAVFDELATQWQVVPMVWWNRKTQVPLVYRPVLWAQGLVMTRAHQQPLRTIIHLIRSWQIDLVYTATSLTIEGALAAKWTGVPHVWHIKETIGSTGRVKFGLPDRWLTSFFNATAGRVLVMTRYIGEIFVRQNQAQKMTVVYDGVEMDRFQGHQKGAALRRQLGLGDEEILVGMVAALSATWKRHELFIDMAAQLSGRFPQARFAAFGTPPVKQRNPAYRRAWHHYQGLIQQVTGAGLGDRFLWPGFVEDIPQLMAALDILVHPCEIEPFGRVAIEAMAAARPVVGPNQGGIAESVIDGETGFLVAPGSSIALAEATGRLVIDPHSRRQFGENGRAHVAANFSLARHVCQMEDIFIAVMNQHQPALFPARPVENSHAP